MNIIIKKRGIIILTTISHCNAGYTSQYQFKSVQNQRNIEICFVDITNKNLKQINVEDCKNLIHAHFLQLVMSIFNIVKFSKLFLKLLYFLWDD
jgi:hypothetical protein